MSKYHGNARMPMIKRIDKIKIHIPIWFIYGTRTWIDYTAAYFAVWLRQCVYQKAQISVEVINIVFNVRIFKLLTQNMVTSS